MIRKLIFFLALLLWGGCQKDTTEERGGNRSNPDGSVGFWLSTESSQPKTGNAETRGTPHNSLDAYNLVCINAYSHTLDYEITSGNDTKLYREIKLEKDGDNWDYTPHMYWPASKKLSFMAYASDIPFKDAGISFIPEKGVPDSIRYKVPSDVTKQPDLLVSTKYNQQQVSNVDLNMKQALACVSFCGIAPEGDIYVKSITLRNVYSEGTLALGDPTITWRLHPDSKGLTALEPGINDGQELGKDPLSDNNYLMTTDGYLMMIPQKLTNAAIDVLYWNGNDDTENRVITYILPVDDDKYASWRPGKKYIYKFGSQSKEDITVVYYEKYDDNSYGLYYYEKGTQRYTLDDTKKISEAGYGVLSKESVGQVAPIRLSSSAATPVTSGAAVPLSETGPFLYTVNQSGANTFTLPQSVMPTDIYFNGNDKSCGVIIPHFAKGVYTSKTLVKTHAIRTPQQMRNITSQSVSPIRMTHTYTQEMDLDFSRVSIGGENLSTPVVNREFNDRFEGNTKRIENVTINASTVNGGLFLSNKGEIEDILLVNSSIHSSGNLGGVVAINEQEGVIIHPRIIGENDTDKRFELRGTSGYVGGIVGLNYGHITGSSTIENATEISVAEVSGWVLIKGVSQPVGGIVGQNHGTITTCLVNGVYVTGKAQGEVVVAKVAIEGGDYVGGIVGVNWARVDGNYSGSGATLQPEPDVAGIVSVSGNNWVGGIAGQNSGASGVLNQVNLRLGRGDVNNAITITGLASVGGIVGFNTQGGTLKADGNSFISVRGNVIIKGTDFVGGIVGNNQSGNISNCFVYNFFSQNTTPLIHHAPKISGESNVGGIVGNAGAGSISQCAVFSTVSASNAAGGNFANARVEIKSNTESAGGIVGRGYSGLNIATSYVLGNVSIDAGTFCGGIVGQNDPGTTIKSVHIGNSSPEVADIYKNLFLAVKLPVDDPRMQTGGSVMTRTSGTPTIVGGTYIGGICGVNWGTVEGVSIKDNIKIGLPACEYVGGIAGGNGLDAIISKCQTYNPPTGDATVDITGIRQIGGIVGVNNGIVEKCRLGLPGPGASRAITIIGTEAMGGIAGINGGHKEYIVNTYPGSGNANTRITECNVYGKVTIKGTGSRIGGILGQNGPTNKVIDCNVIGYASNYSSATSFNYDVTISGYGQIGGIAGTNYGIICGSSTASYSQVTHTAVIGSNLHAGGLVGDIKSRRDSDASNSAFEAELYYCDVAQGVLIHYYDNTSGAFAGQIDGSGATAAKPILFGTAPTGPTNKIYTGSINPVRISAHGTGVIRPPAIENTPVIPPTPHDPNLTGNLWAGYVLNNYLYYTAY